MLRQINSICRAFLWTGTCNSSKPGYVNREDVCRPRSHGGLGLFRALLQWNMAIFGKLVWDIARKADNLWVKWIHDRYIKEQNWNTFVAPHGASWVVKYICKAKNVILRTCGNS